MTKTYKKGLRVLGAVALLAANSLWGQYSRWSTQPVFDNDNQQVNDVAVDGKGNSYTVGFFNGTGVDFINWGSIANTGGTGTFDGFLAMHDTANGDVLWAVTMGGTSNDYTTGVCVYPEGTDNAIYICGHFNGTMTFNSTDGTTTASLTSVGLQDGYIAKYNSSGIVQWAYKIGSTTNDAAYDITATTTHNAFGIPGAALYVCGAYGGNVTFYGQSANLGKNLMGNGNDAYLVRYIDDIGTPDVYADWARGLGTSAGSDAYYGVGADVSANVVVTGLMYNGTATFDISGASTSTFSANGSTEAVAICYNASGTRIWSDHYGGNSTAAGVTDAGLCATMDGNGNSYLGGYFTGTGTFGGSSPTNLGTGLDSYIIRVSSAGTVQWVQTGGTTNTDDMATSLAVDNCGQHLYAVGQYRGNFAFAGFSFSPYNAGTPNVDGFFLTLNAANGNGISGDGTRMGGSDGIDSRNTVAVNGLEHVYVSGCFASTNWYLGGTYSLTNAESPPNGHFDSFLFRWDNISFPAAVTSGTATHEGAGVDDCTIYAAGEMYGANVQFGSTTLSSTLYSVGVYTQDVYLTTCDKYGSYTSFVKVTNGTASEYMEDQYTDASGNNYIGGYAQSGIFNPGNLTFNNGTTVTVNNATWGWVCKTNSAGSVQWGNWISNAGAGNSTVRGVTRDDVGDVYACGQFSGTVTFADAAGGSPINKTSTSGTDMFIAKYNGTTGSLQWVQTFAATTGGTGVSGFSVTTLGTSYYACGSFTGTTTIGANTLVSNGNSDIFVMRGDTTSGSGTYSLRYGSGASLADGGYDVVALATNEVYVAGYANVNAFIGKATLSTSSTSWTWSHTSSSSNATGNRIASHNGFIYMGGSCTSGTLTFGSLSCGTGAYVVRYDNGGTEQCLNRYTGHYLYGLAIEQGSLNNDGGDNIVMTGGTAAYIHVMGLTNCQFSERLADPGSNGEAEPKEELSGSAYPNPADGSVTFELDATYDLTQQPATLVITDITGRVVKQIDGVTGNIITVNTEEFDSGLYQYQFISNGELIGLGKMVIQH